jgi:hypothetical protein
MNPREWPDARMSNLAQTNPPTHKVKLKIIRCYSVAQLRAIQSAQDNEGWMVLLLGENAAYDGGLQGFYDYVPTGQQNTRDEDGASWIIAADGQSAWMKVS